MTETSSPRIHTQCPHCNTIFQINEIQLNALEGKVRCGYCYRVFNAKETLIDELKNKQPEPSAPPSQPVVNLAKPDSQALEAINQAKQELQASTRQQLDTSKAISKSSFTASNLLWGVAISFAIIGFVGQYTYFYRDDLAQQHSQLRPLLERMCKSLDCKLQLAKAPEKFKLISHDMRQDPQHENTLLVRGTFINTADFTQAYPSVKLKLSDLKGETIAQRSFAPTQYLAKSPNLEAGIPPSGSVETELSIVDLGPQVVGFSLETK